MRVHHLNCATLRPAGGRMVCHCLLVEAPDRLVLVDSGFGLQDLERLRGLRPDPRQLFRRFYTSAVLRARLDPAETAVRQVEQLGHAAGNVTDVVLTHLDLDHAGGLADFPAARVHVSAAEHAYATTKPQRRHWDYQWAHGPDWVLYDDAGAEPWLGLEGARELDGLAGMLLVPLPGHSPGQCGVAIRGGAPGATWLLHAADAYFHRREMASGSAPRSIERFERFVASDDGARQRTQERLRRLVREHGDEVDVFCSHDASEFERRAVASP